MTVKELIAELQKFDPEMLVVQRMYSCYSDMKSPGRAIMFKHPHLKDQYEMFYPSQWDRLLQRGFSEGKPETFEVVYFEGN